MVHNFFLKKKKPERYRNRIKEKHYRESKEKKKLRNNTEKQNQEK